MSMNIIPFRVTICGIPELDEHRAAGVTHIVSILDPEWPDLPTFDKFAPHWRLDLRFHDIIEPKPGHLAPSRSDVARLLGFGRELDDRTGSHLLVHCHAGVSRSTAAAALIMVQMHPERPGDALLGRNGEIVAAASAVYRRALDREPLMKEAMIDGGRSREVIAARGSRPHFGLKAAS
jgi:predicted protein tyrosine phosphatase